MTAADLVEFRTDSAWIDLRLNRPDARNALSLEMLAALAAALDKATSHPASVLHLCGAGPVFCAGFDLEEAVTDASAIAEMIRRLGALCRRLRTLPQTVVATVQGAALAGGCAIVSACDFVVADPQATFGYPVHGLGISPAVTLPTLNAALGYGRARTLTLSGRVIDAAEAQRFGLVSHVADQSGKEALEAASRVVLRTLTGKGPQALRTTKQWLTHLDNHFARPGAERATEHSATAAESPQARQLLAEFWDARKRRGARGS